MAKGRELAARFDAERAAARSSLAGVATDSWWAEADPEPIGAAYKTAMSWAGQDAEIADNLRHMDERLAAASTSPPRCPNGSATSSAPGPGRPEHDPFLDEAFTRKWTQARTPAERDRLNTALVSAWLTRPEAQTAAADADRLEGDAAREAVNAAGHRLDGDRAEGLSSAT